MVAINRKAAVNAIVSESVNDIAKKRRIKESKRLGEVLLINFQRSGMRNANSVDTQVATTS